MFSRQLLKRTYTTTKVPVDEYCIPIKPTWSIQSLIDPVGSPISDAQFKHLLALSRLETPSAEQTQKLKAEIDQLTQFTNHMQSHSDLQDIEPLTHIWQQGQGQLLRSDTDIEVGDEKRGRALLKHAKTKSGHFYIVKGTE